MLHVIAQAVPQFAPSFPNPHSQPHLLLSLHILHSSQTGLLISFQHSILLPIAVPSFLLFCLILPALVIYAKSYPVSPIRIYPSPTLCFHDIVSMNDRAQLSHSVVSSLIIVHLVLAMRYCALVRDTHACSLRAASTETYTWQALSQDSISTRHQSCQWIRNHLFVHPLGLWLKWLFFFSFLDSLCPSLFHRNSFTSVYFPLHLSSFWADGGGWSKRFPPQFLCPFLGFDQVRILSLLESTEHDFLPPTLPTQQCRL